MAGYVARLVINREYRDGMPCPEFQPEKSVCWIEYLVGENADGPVFSEEKARALIFPSHGLADERAEEIRRAHPALGPVYGASYSLGAVEEAVREAEVNRRDRRRRRAPSEDEEEANTYAWQERADLR